MNSGKVKAPATVKRALRELRKFIDSEDATVIQKRIAYEMECAVRWATEPVVGWPSLVQHAIDGAAILERDLSVEQGSDAVRPSSKSSPEANHE